jgi:hypothetical protein
MLDFTWGGKRARPQAANHTGRREIAHPVVAAHVGWCHVPCSSSPGPCPGGTRVRNLRHRRAQQALQERAKRTDKSTKGTDMNIFSQLAGSPATLVMLAAGMQMASLLLAWLTADVFMRGNISAHRFARMRSLQLRAVGRDAAAPRPAKIRALVVPLVPAQAAVRPMAPVMMVRDAA